ncbi:MAG: transcription antitermination factor NusB, partial [Salinibacterium sp.]|nr:transcription antitermination factor NusB [Salinibacterium sp.]
MAASPRAIRKLAFQALFQLDARGGPDGEEVRQTLDDAEKYSPADRDKAYALAMAAYEARDKADREFALLAPQWPAHRQPSADRAALRLGHFELTTGRVPPKVAINEAVEIARLFGGERSPGFVNGLLSKVLQRLSAEPVAVDRTKILGDGSE